VVSAKRISGGLLALLVAIAAGAACAADQDDPAPAAQPAPAQAISWTSLTPDEQRVLEQVRDSWSQLPAEAQQRLRRGAQRWAQMTPEQRVRVEQRLQRWNEMTPDQRAGLRQRYEKFEQLPPEQQQRIRAAFRRFGNLPPGERAHLREQFDQMTPAQREAFLDGATAQHRAAIIREFNQSMPPEERRATHEMLRSLTPGQRRAFHVAWRNLPPAQRDDYRRRVLGMTPELYAKIADSLTVYSRQAGINTTTASRNVLMAIPGVTAEAVDTYIAQREEARANKLPLPAFPGAGNTATGAVAVWRIRTQATMPDGVTFVREAVMRPSPYPKRPVIALLWQEGSFSAPVAPPASNGATAPPTTASTDGNRPR